MPVCHAKCQGVNAEGLVFEKHMVHYYFLGGSLFSWFMSRMCNGTSPCSYLSFSILRFCSLETRKKEAGTPAPFLPDSHSDQIPSSMELDASRLFSPTMCHVMPTTALWGEQDRCWHPFSRCGSRGREGKRLAGYHRGWD